MRCPDCGARAEVLDSRPRPDGAVRRRRRCTGCDKRFTTDERARVGADELAVRVAALALSLSNHDRDPIGIGS
jgi:transcriptional regulator NrdR family protein